MRLHVLGLAALLAIFLTGCGVLGGPTPTLRADISPTVPGFEVDDSGDIIIVANNIQFTNAPNGAEAMITGYSVSVYNSAGESLLGPGSQIYSDFQAIPVPPGYRCADGEDDCDVGERIPVNDASSEPRPFILTAGPVASHVVLSGQVTARAEITFYADWGARRNYSWTGSTTITYPVGGD